MIDWLKNEWQLLTSKYTNNTSLIDDLWLEIKNQYSQKSRYYHNLSHIHNMLLKAEDFKNEIYDFDVLKLTIWYHDIIYKSTKKDNEEKSVVFAKKRLKSLNFDEKRIKIVQNLIISTKKHELILHDNSDNALLLDLDLSILGSSWESYKKYIQNIRKEYKIYPNFMYNPGRKKVLEHFLKRESLYFTDSFKNEYEIQARENLKREIELL